MSTITVTGDYVVQSTEDVTLDAGSSLNYAAYTLQITPPIYAMSFTDNGTVQVTSSVNDGTVEGLFDTPIAQYHTDTIAIAAGATFLVTATGPGSTAYGFYGYSGEEGVFVTNDGAFTVSAVAQATGAYIGGGGTFTNNAALQVSSAGFATGVYMSYGGSFTNTGQFTVSGDDATGVYMGDGASTPANILNTGVITITASTEDVSGFVLDNISSGSFVNQGTVTVIRGGGRWFAIDIEGVNASAAPYVIDNSGSITGLVYAESTNQTHIDLTNTGTMNGGIALNSTTFATHAASGYDNEIHNSGAITGDIYLSGNGNDLYDGRGGTLYGRIILRGGNDTIFLGDDGGVVFGTEHGASGHITGGAGDDDITFDNHDGAFVIDGGGGNDLITGGGGNDVIDGGAGDDGLDGGGGINTVTYASATSGVHVSLGLQHDPSAPGLWAQDTGGAGFDGLSNFQNLTGSAFNDTLEGDSQDNVLTGGAGADTFVITAGGHDTIADFSQAEGDRIDLTPLHTFFSMADVLTAMSQSGADTVIDLGGGNSVTLAGVQMTSLTAADFILAPILVTAPNEVVTIDASANLTSTGDALILFNLPFLASATVINDGSLSLTSASRATLIGPQPNSLGQAVGVGDFENHGTVSFQAAGGVFAVCNTLDNLGSINVTSTGDVTGVEGNLVNAGTLTVQGATQVFGVDAANLVQNLAGGVLTISPASGQVTGIRLEYGGELDNAGAITVTGSAAYGVFLNGEVYNLNGPNGFSLVNNSGTLTVTGAGGIGVGMWSTSALEVPAGQYNVVNSGTITAETVIDFSLGPLLVPIGAAIDNSGVLNGLVQLSNNDDRLLNTGTINGAVDLGDGNDTLDSHLGTITGVVTLGSGWSTVILGAEDNTIAMTVGNHVVDGGGGSNTVSYANATPGVDVSLAEQGQLQFTGVGWDTLTNIQNLIGSTYYGSVLEGGGAAATTVTGGYGADDFVYRHGDGNVTVTNFSHAQGDKIDLSPMSDYATFADVLPHAAQVGSDTVITFGAGDSLTLAHVALASLTAGDFLLGPNAGPDTGGKAKLAPPGGGELDGTPGIDWLQGQGGNDILHGGPGSDYLDGGGGLNTATYDGVYRQYTVTVTEPPIMMKVTGGPDFGTDGLINIQRIQFTDGYLAYSPTDTAGQVYRLYEATLGRPPDQEGLTNWVNALNSGVSLQTVANGFVGSQEFQGIYGPLTDTDFVTLLYNNVLHRAPDQAGLDNWVGFLTSGQQSRAQVVLGFSESQEDITDFTPAVQQGLWVADPYAAEVDRLYDTVLGREPDAAGLANWTNMLESGTSLQTVANGFVGSQEFQSVSGGLDNTGFVTLLYNNVLHRAPDAQGLSNWVGYLTSGADTRAQVVLGFSESPEHIANEAPYIDSGIWVTG